MESRHGTAGLAFPPWLWVWLAAYLVPVMPGVIRGNVREIVSGLPWDSLIPPSRAVFTADLLSSIFEVLLYVMVTAGVLGVIFPHLRGRWVERKFKLTTYDRPVVAEMRQFVHEHDPSIRLLVSVRGDQMARIYPVSWRSARIAVFLPFTALWRRDPQAAEAILLHELAHKRQGDQLITGLGSPLVWLVRICVPAYLLLDLIPTVIADGTRVAAVSALQEPTAILLPVIGLWMAEFGADRQTTQHIGADALQRALREVAGPRASLAARAMTLLSHPPRRLRLRCATAGRVGTAALVAAWPAALVAFLLIPLALNIAGPAPSGITPALEGLIRRLVVNGAISGGEPVVIATALVLVAWPALAAPWEWLWSSRKPSGRHQPPWWPYLATAGVPAAMLILASLTPPAPTTQQVIDANLTKGPASVCSTIADWSAGGLGRSGMLTTYLVGFLQALVEGDNRTVVASAARSVDAEAQVALSNPPPGAARSSYIQMVTDELTAVQDYMHGDTQAGSKELDAAWRSNAAVNTVINECLGLHSPTTTTAPPLPIPTITFSPSPQSSPTFTPPDSAYDVQPGGCVFGADGSGRQWNAVSCADGNFTVQEVYAGTTNTSLCSTVWGTYHRTYKLSNSERDELQCLRFNYFSVMGYATVNKCFAASGPPNDLTFSNTPSCVSGDVVVTAHYRADDPADCTSSDGYDTGDPPGFPGLAWTVCFNYIN